MSRPRIWWVVCLLAAAGPSAWAEGDIVVAPTRLVLDNRDDGVVYVHNVGSEDAQITAGFVERGMDASGGLVPLDASPHAASPYVLYAPRFVVLHPGERQVFRLLVRPSPPAGEFRSHLEISAVSAGRSYRLTLPVIIRRGPVSAVLSLVPLTWRRIQGDRWLAEVWLERRGSAGVFGNLDFDLACPGREAKRLAGRKGLAVYAEVPRRLVQTEVRVPPRTPLEGCSIRATYSNLEAPGPAAVAQVASF